MKPHEIERLILLNGRRLFNATHGPSIEAFKRRQRSLYAMLIHAERYEAYKAEEAVTEALTAP